MATGIDAPVRVGYDGPLPQDNGDEDRGRRMDPELLVLQRMLRMMEELPEPGRGRVMNYLADRYSEQNAV